LESNATHSAPSYKKTFWVFALLWVITFIIYLPAARAGKVGEYYREWLDIVMNKGLKYFLHPQGFPSLYHFTQATTYVFYRIFGFGPWPWHILALTVHVCNALLIYLIFKRLLTDARIRNAMPVAFGSALLFCISSYNSEVIVHEPCYHYTQGFLLQLLILFLAQQFIHHYSVRYAWWAGALYIAASFSIEVFYLTPVFVLMLALYYHNVLHIGKTRLKKIILYFVVPEAFIFILHIALLRWSTGHVIGHFLEPAKNEFFYDLITKAPKYLFNVIFLGRYFTEETKRAVYGFFDSHTGIIWSASLLAVYYLYVALRFRKLSALGKLTAMLFTWVLLCVAIVCFLAFPDTQLVWYDRYTYFMQPFIYLLIILLIYRAPYKFITIPLLTAVCVVNLFFTFKVNDLWHKSSVITENLMKNFPDPKDKIVLLLNVPENMNGVLMSGSGAPCAFKTMYNFENSSKINAPVYDLLSYNMLTPQDGAHVMVIFDSVLHVTLNQWGTWWWHGYKGAASYETNEFRLNLTDPGHWYELTLKLPASRYLLLYQVDDQWRTVDMGKKNIDQY
jgi:hypothetical protein